MISPARRIAFDVLERVETRGSWASDVLRALSAEADSRDAALAAEIAMGTLRRQLTLDYLLTAAAGRAVSAMDAQVRIALRMGLYQLRYLDRVPAHSAVSESVDLVKRARKSSAAGLVNAVLRKAPRGEVEFPSDSVRLSMPEWLLDRWTARWGREVALGIARAALDPPVLYVRASGPAGTERIQDIGSQWVVTLLDLEPGQRFLDVCSAPGNKTAQALESGVRAIACDFHLHRLRAMPELPCPRVALDASKAMPFGPVFDRILVDAPCSGTGTLGRNPEIKWRLKPEDLADLAVRQKAILANSLGCLKPGGRLVYSTCSLEYEENEGVAGTGVTQFQRIPGRDAGDGFFAAIFPVA